MQAKDVMKLNRYHIRVAGVSKKALSREEVDLPGFGGVYTPANLGLFTYAHCAPTQYVDAEGLVLGKLLIIAAVGGIAYFAHTTNEAFKREQKRQENIEKFLKNPNEQNAGRMIEDQKQRIQDADKIREAGENISIPSSPSRSRNYPAETAPGGNQPRYPIFPKNDPDRPYAPGYNRSNRPADRSGEQ
jgi:hypothetical protein